MSQGLEVVRLSVAPEVFAGGGGDGPGDELGRHVDVGQVLQVFRLTGDDYPFGREVGVGLFAETAAIPGHLPGQAQFLGRVQDGRLDVVVAVRGVEAHD